jgi:hypothetical protein
MAHYAHYAVRLALGGCLLLGGCDTVAIALLGGGASTLLRYNLDGVAARTFTASAASVKNASLAALERMGLALDGTDSYEAGEIIRARSPNRSIEIELEPITPQATRMRITAHTPGLFYDSATATELVQQTEKILDTVASAKLVPPTPAASAVAGPRLTAN